MASSMSAAGVTCGAGVGQRIGPFVALVAGVTLHPPPADLVTSCLGLQRAPQVIVLDRLLPGGLPAALLPIVDPLGDALAHVLAVGVHDHLAGPSECPQPLDDRRELHPVVGGQSLTADQLAFV